MSWWTFSIKKIGKWLDPLRNIVLQFPIGDIKITQTNAILRYLGRKYQLEGKTEAEKARCDMMTENAMDFRNGFVGLSYLSKEKFNETKPTYLKNLEPKLEGFSKYLGTNNTIIILNFWRNWIDMKNDHICFLFF